MLMIVVFKCVLRSQLVPALNWPHVSKNTFYLMHFRGGTNHFIQNACHLVKCIHRHQFDLEL